MSMIVPAGNKNVDWSPKHDSLTKTASTDSVQEEVNPLYEAAKKYAASLSTPESCEKCQKCPCECAVSDSKPAGSLQIGTEEVASEGKDKVEVAVEKVDAAVTELKDAVGVGEVDQVEIEIEDASAPTDVNAIPGEKVQGGEIIVESEPKCACTAASAASSDVKSDVKSDAKSDVKSDVKTAASSSSAKPWEKAKSDAKSDSASSDAKSDAKSDTKANAEIVMEKAAGTEEQFVKIANISPENRKKLANYWVTMLNYPKDYVALMTKDYEK